MLRRLAKQAVPGVPIHFKIVYMQQELSEFPNTTARQYIQSNTNVNGDKNKMELIDRECQLNTQLEAATDSEEIAYLAECLSEVADELDKIDSKSSDEGTASDILLVVTVF